MAMHIIKCYYSIYMLSNELYTLQYNTEYMYVMVD